MAAISAIDIALWDLAVAQAASIQWIAALSAGPGLGITVRADTVERFSTGWCG